jgi:hypothetical protein
VRGPVVVRIDLAKNVFTVRGVNAAGKAETVRPDVPRAKLHELIVALPACAIGMKAYSRAHLNCIPNRHLIKVGVALTRKSGCRLPRVRGVNLCSLL